MTHQIVIEPFTSTAVAAKRAQRYRVWHNGAVLIENTWKPEFDACRALLALGITGQLETWRRNRPYACMVMDIESGAKLTVVETDKEGPLITKWNPFEDRSQEADCCRDVSSAGEQNEVG